MYSEKRQFGNIGEDLAVKFLMKQGFSIKTRNFLRKCGEIDIVAEKRHKIHFIEVKSVSRDLEVPHETTEYRPEDNVHPAKLKRLYKTIEIYLMDQKVSDETEWQIDIVLVYIDKIHKLAKIKTLENIIGE